MATNPIGKGTKTIGINMDAKLADELEKRAKSMHLSVSKYCKIILTRWIGSGRKLKLEERQKTGFMLVRLTLVPLVMVACQSHAGLDWESKSIRLKADPGQSSVTVEFACRNTGKDTVAIGKVKTSCGCTSATITKKTIAPEEQGTIRGNFVFGNREGLQRKRFEVVTNDGKRHTLYLSVDIPRTYQVFPRRLSWNSPDDRAAKSCRMVNVSTTPIKIASAKSSSPAFNAELKELRSGFEYEVLVTPTGTNNPIKAIITASTEPINGHKPRTYKIYAVSKQR